MDYLIWADNDQLFSSIDVIQKFNQCMQLKAYFLKCTEQQCIIILSKGR